MTRIIKISVVGIILFLTMFYGALAHKFHLFPYSLFVSGYAVLQPNKHNDIQQEHTGTNVAELISIKKPIDVSNKRDILIDFLWGKLGIPSLNPSSIINNWKDNRYEDIDSIKQIDKLIVTMEYNLKSYIYHFIPHKPNNEIVLYHQGHKGDFFHGKQQIERLLDNGYAVMAFSMPLLGLNNQPTIEVNGIGKFKISSHNKMSFLSPKSGNPVKYFIEPIISSLNYLDENFNYHSVSMIGISGGGWTTTLASAVDVRILNSFPVSGSYPIYLRANNDWGDYEQTIPELYKAVNYLELYVLGSYGDNRTQLQIINKYDPCCFAGVKWQTYAEIVRARTFQLGSGEYDLFLDDSHKQHMISNLAMSKILNKISDNRK